MLNHYVAFVGHRPHLRSVRHYPHKESVGLRRLRVISKVMSTFLLSPIGSPEATAWSKEANEQRKRRVDVGGWEEILPDCYQS